MADELFRQAEKNSKRILLELVIVCLCLLIGGLVFWWFDFVAMFHFEKNLQFADMLFNSIITGCV